MSLCPSHSRCSRAFASAVAFILNLVLPLDKEELDQTVHLGGHVESTEELTKEEETEMVAFA